jgi:hypothetical protein
MTGLYLLFQYQRMKKYEALANVDGTKTSTYGTFYPIVSDNVVKKQGISYGQQSNQNFRVKKSAVFLA